MPEGEIRPTEKWPLQERYKLELHQRIQKWGGRVLPMFETLGDEEVLERSKLFEFLVTSVERDDSHTALLIGGLDSYAREYCEGPGMYGRGGGSIDSVVGVRLCQSQFEGLFAVFNTGRD